MSKLHTSVMLKETLQFFENKELKVFYEGTVGMGGHAKSLLKSHGEIEKYFACDLDEQALAVAKEELAPWKDKVEFIHGNFAHLREHLRERGIKSVDGFFLILESPRFSSIAARGDLVSCGRDL